jgi:glucose-6-phosphate 1-dehydrogenase
MPDLREGCKTGKCVEDKAPADALVLFGAMGDLAHNKIFPALYHMVQHGHLDVSVIGVARLGGRTNISKSACATASSSKATTSIKKPWPSF